MIDVERARRDTPAALTLLHFNNAGASLMPAPVVTAVTNYFSEEVVSGGYETEAAHHEELEQVYDSIATLIGARRDEIAVTDSATRAWAHAFYSLTFRPGDRILVSGAEYVSNYIALLQVARRSGAEIIVVPNNEAGETSLDALRNLIDDRVKLIAVTHVPTSSGLVNPVAEVGVIAKQAGILYLLDACQSVGQMEVNVESIGCDFLAATGRKFLRAPRGTGFLYARRESTEAIEPAMLDGQGALWASRDTFEMRKDARRFESYETSFASKIGLGAAVDYALSFGLRAIGERVRHLADDLRARLAELPGVTVRDRGARLCGIVTFTVLGADHTQIRDRLREMRINIWVSALSSSRLELESKGLSSVARASVHYYNTEGEIQAFVRALSSLLRGR